MSSCGDFLEQVPSITKFAPTDLFPCDKKKKWLQLTLGHTEYYRKIDFSLIQTSSENTLWFQKDIDKQNPLRKGSHFHASEF